MTESPVGPMNLHRRGRAMASWRSTVARRTAPGLQHQQPRFASTVSIIFYAVIHLYDFIDLGTAVAIYGTSDTFTVSKYVVDDLEPVIFNSPDPASQLARFHTLFYQSPVLDDGSHRVVVTCLTNQSDNTLWLDYAIYQPSSPSSSSTNPSSAPTSATSGRTTSGANATAIVGGVLGALVLSMALLLVFFFRRRFPRKPSSPKRECKRDFRQSARPLIRS